MEQYAWLIWLILGIVFIIAEIFTLGFVLFWFGLASIAAALLGMMGFGFGIQFAVFALVSIGLTVMSRTIFSSYLPHSAEIKMGMDSLPGQIGTVTTASKGALDEGAVKVFGSVWTAFPVDSNATLVEGEKVEVVSVKGSAIYVRPVDDKLLGWRDPEDKITID